jgi:hypothetical protein
LCFRLPSGIFVLKNVSCGGENVDCL